MILRFFKLITLKSNFTLYLKMSMTRSFIFRSSRTASSPFDKIFISFVKFRIFLSYLISSLSITVKGHSWRTPSFSFESISYLHIKEIFFKFNVWNLFRSPFWMFELTDLIFDINEQFIAFPCCLLNWVIFPFNQVKSLAIEDLFIENLFNL